MRHIYLFGLFAGVLIFSGCSKSQPKGGNNRANIKKDKIIEQNQNKLKKNQSEVATENQQVESENNQQGVVEVKTNDGVQDLKEVETSKVVQQSADPIIKIKENLQNYKLGSTQHLELLDELKGEVTKIETAKKAYDLSLFLIRTFFEYSKYPNDYDRGTDSYLNVQKKVAVLIDEVLLKEKHLNKMTLDQSLDVVVETTPYVLLSDLSDDTKNIHLTKVSKVALKDEEAFKSKVIPKLFKPLSENPNNEYLYLPLLQHLYSLKPEWVIDGLAASGLKGNIKALVLIEASVAKPHLKNLKDKKELKQSREALVKILKTKASKDLPARVYVRRFEIYTPLKRSLVETDNVDKFLYPEDFRSDLLNDFGDIGERYLKSGEPKDAIDMVKKIRTDFFNQYKKIPKGWQNNKKRNEINERARPYSEVKKGSMLQDILYSLTEIASSERGDSSFRLSATILKEKIRPAIMSGRTIEESMALIDSSGIKEFSLGRELMINTFNAYMNLATDLGVQSTFKAFFPNLIEMYVKNNSFEAEKILTQHEDLGINQDWAIEPLKKHISDQKLISKNKSRHLTVKRGLFLAGWFNPSAYVEKHLPTLRESSNLNNLDPMPYVIQGLTDKTDAKPLWKLLIDIVTLQNGIKVNRHTLIGFDDPLLALAQKRPDWIESKMIPFLIEQSISDKKPFGMAPALKKLINETNRQSYFEQTHMRPLFTKIANNKALSATEGKTFSMLSGYHDDTSTKIFKSLLEATQKENLAAKKKLIQSFGTESINFTQNVLFPLISKNTGEPWMNQPELRMEVLELWAKQQTYIKEELLVEDINDEKTLMTAWFETAFQLLKTYASKNDGKLKYGMKLLHLIGDLSKVDRKLIEYLVSEYKKKEENKSLSEYDFWNVISHTIKNYY